MAGVIIPQALAAGPAVVGAAVRLVVSQAVQPKPDKETTAAAVVLPAQQAEVEVVRGPQVQALSLSQHQRLAVREKSVRSPESRSLMPEVVAGATLRIAQPSVGQAEAGMAGSAFKPAAVRMA